MNLTCQYPPRIQGKQSRPSHSPPLNVLTADDLWLDQIDPALFDLDFSPIPTNYESTSSLHASPSPAPDGIPITKPLSPIPSSIAILRSPGAQSLAPAEYELFQHFVEHTSKDLTVEEEEQYTLQIGIPSLACRAKPLMRSVLAISAICKAWDLINHASSMPLSSLRLQVKQLLSQAHKYHMESVREIQITIRNDKCYDTVLANAAMMGMYGSGSYCTRIWLIKTYSHESIERKEEEEDLDRQPRWFSLFRAVDIAYGGLLHGRSTCPPAEGPFPTWTPSSFQLQYEFKVLPTPRLGGPPSIHDHVLSPILAATLGSAMNKLHDKANAVAATYPMDQTLHGCFTALTLLSKVAAKAFPSQQSADENVASMPSTPGTTLSFEPVDIDPGVGKLSKISPWIRRYTASITSIIPSRLPRRMIVSFIHKIPCSYLDVVMELTSPEAMSSSSSEETMRQEKPSMAEQLAVEIFAHWSVLTLLLDTVWWIGGIGAFELGRLVQLRKDVIAEGRWAAEEGCCIWKPGEDWWPESMYEVSRQLDKHKSFEG
ncbi:hypothetical protein QBC35DRAFT_510291 [Podospora australis]|uniref:Transcription factor domain-containing protein n=1 Tax=Podospora australis TaxID=1536484 RepID=A0AAN7ADQ8_9PEZI|nr:hypothetical protein QBC35DRAFT_510291 [Podospora australis]